MYHLQILLYNQQYVFFPFENKSDNGLNITAHFIGSEISLIYHKITPYKSNTDERTPVVTASSTFIMQTYTYPHLSYNYDNNKDQ